MPARVVAASVDPPLLPEGGDHTRRTPQLAPPARAATSAGMVALLGGNGPPPPNTPGKLQEA
eukprot:15441116-Alexandrium_andersonii.AAC.1